MVSQLVSDDGSIQVVARVRPIFEGEVSRATVVDVDEEQSCLRVDGGTYYNKERLFSLHRVFGPNVRQCHLFDVCVSPLVDDVLLGYNVVVFAYGQTGSGKTYTMEGPTAPTAPPAHGRMGNVRRRATVSATDAFGDHHCNTPLRRSSSQAGLQEEKKHNGLETFLRSSSSSSTLPKTCPSTSFDSGSGSENENEIPDESLTSLAEEHGFVQRSIYALFDRLELNHRGLYEVNLSHLELYNEEMYDLMVAKDDLRRGSRTAFGSGVSRHHGLRLEEDNQGRVRCGGLLEYSILDASRAIALAKHSARARATRATLSNDRSSRSHSILTFNVSVKNGIDERGMNVERYGQLSLVDLAGSECLKRSGAHGSLARESATINQSLLTLGRVITALVSKQPHIPYRDSKLTRLLQDSLGGSSKTLIVATVSPLKNHLDETVSTLTYAMNAARIVNAPKRNMRTSMNERIKSLTDENARLRELLLATQEKNGEIVPTGMLQCMETELNDLREHLGLAHQRVEISEERTKVLVQRVSEKDRQLEANVHQLEMRDRQLEIYQPELEEEKCKNRELMDMITVVGNERAAFAAHTEELLARDKQLREEMQSDFSDLFTDLRAYWPGIASLSPRDGLPVGSGSSAAAAVTRALRSQLLQHTEEAAQRKSEMSEQESAAAECEATLRSALRAVEMRLAEAQETISSQSAAAERAAASSRTELQQRDTAAADFAAASRATMIATEAAEAAMARECETLAARAAREASLVENLQAKMAAQSETAAREAHRLERTVCAAAAEFAQKLASQRAYCWQDEIDK